MKLVSLVVLASLMGSGSAAASLAMLGSAAATAAAAMVGSASLATGAAVDGCVLVTGATGFVAGHIVEELLGQGLTVHGTVRSLKDESKTQFLREMDERLPGSLRLFEADLDADNAFDAAAEGCSGMLHVASVVMADVAPELQVASAVKGTLSALDAALKHGFKTVVVTSSVASISFDKDRLEKLGAAYPVSTEADWNTLSTLHDGTYAFSKVSAEKATLKWLEEHKTKDGSAPFRYASIHFPVAIGPQQTKRVTSSNLVVALFLRGEMPFSIPMRTSVVGVVDVARAHVHVLQHEKAQGRYIVALDPVASAVNPADICKILKRNFPDQPVSPAFELPVPLTSLLSYGDSRIVSSMFKSAYIFDHHPGYDGSRIATELGFEYKHTDPEEFIVTAAQSMLDLGIADGVRHPIIAAHVFAAAIVLVPFFAVVLVLRRLCSSGGPPKQKQT